MLFWRWYNKLHKDENRFGQIFHSPLIRQLDTASRNDSKSFEKEAECPH
jgi:hypothetical protein